MFRAIISHFLGRLLKSCFENIFNFIRDILLFSVLLWRGVFHASPELCCFLQFCQAEVWKQGSCRQGRRVLRQGQPRQLLLCCAPGSASAWRARLGSVAQDKACVWAGDGLVPAPAVVDCPSAITSPAAGTASLTSHVSPTSWNNPGLIHGQQNSILPARLETFSRADVAAAAHPGTGVSWRRRCSTNAAQWLHLV